MIQNRDLDSYKVNVKAASTTHVDLTTVYPVIDGYQTEKGDRILLKDQTDAKQNGIYKCLANGLSLAFDIDNNTSYTNGAFTRTTNGVDNINKEFYCPPIKPTDYNNANKNWIESPFITGGSTPLSIDVEYTGIPVAPIALNLIEPAAIIETVPAIGNNTYFPFSDGVAITEFINIETDVLNNSSLGLMYIKFNNLINVRGTITLIRNRLLTKAEFPELEVAGEVMIKGTNAQDSELESLNFDKLRIITGTLEITNFPLLEVLSFPLLENCGLLNIFGVACSTIELPSLQSTFDNFSINAPSLVSFNASSLRFTPGLVLHATLLELISFPSLERTAAFSLSGNSLVTFVDCPILANIDGNFTLNFMGALTSVNFESLTSVGGTTQISSCSSLIALDFPLLNTANNFSIGITSGSNLNSLLTINLPSLVTLTSSLSVGFSGASILLLNNLNAPLLTTIQGQLNVRNVPSLENIAFPSLTDVSGAITINQTNTALTTVDLSALIDAGNNIVFTNPSPTVPALDPKTFNVTLGTIGITKRINGNITATNQRLPVASIEQMLAVLVSLDGTSGTTLYGSGRTINFSGGSSAGVGALSPAGAADRLTLIGRGVTVTMNA